MHDMQGTFAIAPNEHFVEEALRVLDAHKDEWARLPVPERIELLSAMKDGIMAVARGWAETAARKKQIAAGSPLEGEEWLGGPYATMAGVNTLIGTLSQMKGKAFLDHLPVRTL